MLLKIIAAVIVGTILFLLLVTAGYSVDTIIESELVLLIVILAVAVTWQKRSRNT
jgi:hypothetical protein